MHIHREELHRRLRLGGQGIEPPSECRRFVGSRGSGSRGMTPRHWWGETQGEEALKSVLGPDRVGGHEAELA
jgi:hypothetical protein